MNLIVLIFTKQASKCSKETILSQKIAWSLFRVYVKSFRKKVHCDLMIPNEVTNEKYSCYLIDLSNQIAHLSNVMTDHLNKRSCYISSRTNIFISVIRSELSKRTINCIWLLSMRIRLHNFRDHDIHIRIVSLWGEILNLLKIWCSNHQVS